MTLNGSPLLLREVAAAGSGDDTAYQIKKSLQFHDSYDNYITKTPTIKGNKRTFTISLWHRKDEEGSTGELYTSAQGDTAAARNEALKYHGSGYLYTNFNPSSGTWHESNTSSIISDVGAWNHVVLAVDNNEWAEANRVKIWVNGKKMAIGTLDALSQGDETTVNSTYQQTIGRYEAGDSSYVSGNVADFYLIDGLALSPASFGKFDDNNVWVAIDYTPPTPNDGTTWSSKVSGSAHGSYPWTNAFDGLETTYMYAAASSDTTWTPDSPIKGSTIEILMYAGGSNGFPAVEVNGHLYGDPAGGGDDYTGVWVDVAEQCNYSLESVKVYGVANKQAGFAAIKVDGVILQDGITDSADIVNPNVGQLWSDNSYLSYAGGNYGGGHSAGKAFDGNVVTRGVTSNTNQAVTFTPPGGIPFKTKVEFLNNAAEMDVTVNGGSAVTVPASASGTSNNWKTVATGPGTLTTLVSSKSGTYGSIGAIRVDGYVLVDNIIDHSFKFNFNDVTSDQKTLGYDTLNFTPGNAKNAGPILNTTERSTTTSGNSTDEHSDKLVFAWAGNSLTTDSTGNHTLTNNNSVSLNTTEPILYGACGDFGAANEQKYISAPESADFDFGTGSWTIETWIRRDSDAANANDIMGVWQFQGDGAGGNNEEWLALLWYSDTKKYVFYYGQDGAANGNHTNIALPNLDVGATKINLWHHFAVSFKHDDTANGTLRLFINGVQVGKVSDSTTNSSSGTKQNGWGGSNKDLHLGIQEWNRNFSGQLQDFRIYKGVAKYTSNFKCPKFNDWTPYNYKPQNIGTGDYVTGQWSGDVRAITDSYGPFTCFDGPPPSTGNDTGSTYSLYSANSDCTWTPTGTIQNITKLEIWVFKSGGNGPGQFEINGTNEYGNVTDWDGWNTWTNISTLTSIKIGYGGGGGGVNEAIGIKGIRINDVLLVDNFVDHTDNAISPVVDSPTEYGTDDGAGGELRTTYAKLNWMDRFDIKPHQGEDPQEGGTGNTAYGHVRATQSVSGDKYYWEQELPVNKLSTDLAHISFGIMRSDVELQTTTDNLGSGLATAVGFRMDSGDVYSGGSSIANWNTPIGGDTIGVAFDGTTGKLWFSVNGTWQGSGNPATGANPVATVDITKGYEWMPVVAIKDGFLGIKWNAGKRPFRNAAPSGFKCLCHGNVTNDIANPRDHFDIEQWTGIGTARSIVGLKFKPGLLWTKTKSHATDYKLASTIIGVQKYFDGNQDRDLETDANSFTAFGNNGFSIGTSGDVNSSTRTYVAWCWNAGTQTTSANNNGDINIASGDQWVNDDAGFSMTKYAGSLSNTGVATVGHGLSKAPQFIITKADADTQWQIRHQFLTSWNHTLRLDQDGAEVSKSGNGSMSAPTSTVFGTNYTDGLNVSGQNFYAWCWYEVKGYSKFGVYTGNGQTGYGSAYNNLGPFIYCGFKPRWLLIKNNSNSAHWQQLDSDRDTVMPASIGFYPNLSNAQESDAAYSVDFLSNGFRVRNTNSTMNTDGDEYVFAAFADAPLKHTRGMS